MRATLLGVAVAVLVAATAACSGAEGDKAGGEQGAKTLVLTLEQWNSSYGGEEFAAAVAARSGGSIKVDVRPALAPTDPDFERAIAADVRRGKADIGIVAARVWDTLSVPTFRALLAPFLVDSLELEGKVLDGPLAARMLAGVERYGVVGLAVLPGPLRRPFGYRRALVAPADYAGARIGVRPGRVEEATFHSLGANTRVFVTLDGASREGAALDPDAIVGEGHYRGRTLAANVVFWPRAETVVINRRSFSALTAAQQEIVLRAGRDAVFPRLTQIERAELDAMRSICARGLASLVPASPAELAGLRAAVRPVYAQLEREPETRALIASIRGLDDGREPMPLRCPRSTTGGASAIEGTWASKATRAELLAAGATRREADRYEGRGTLELGDGRWQFTDSRGSVAGRYAVIGNLVRMTIATCSINPCSPGETVELDWSVYRDTLTLTPLAGRPSWARLVANPAHRSG